MKILVIINISILQFYGYIENILVDSLKKNINKIKMDQNSWKYKNQCHKNVIRRIIDILNFFFFKEFNICTIQFIIFDNNIIYIL